MKALDPDCVTVGESWMWPDSRPRTRGGWASARSPACLAVCDVPEEQNVEIGLRLARTPAQQMGKESSC